MIRQPIQTRAIRTRAKIMTAGAAEFAARGYAAATAKSIAKRARVAIGSFYQYFPSKDVLLLELVAARHALAEAQAFAALEGDDGVYPIAEPRARIAALVEATIEQHRADPGFHAVFTERRVVDPDIDRVITDHEHRLVHRVADLLARIGFTGDPIAAAFVLFNMIEGSVHAHVLGRPVVDDARFVHALVDATLRVALPHGPH